jgi:hypothetical protein
LPKNDGAADGGGKQDGELPHSGEARDHNQVSPHGRRSGFDPELNDYILDMIRQLADLAIEIGNDELARQLAEAVRSARRFRG